MEDVRKDTFPDVRGHDLAVKSTGSRLGRFGDGKSKLTLEN